MSGFDVTEAKAWVAEMDDLISRNGTAGDKALFAQERRALAIVRVLVEQVEAHTAENEKLREALFQVFVNLGEDTDGITSGAEFDAHVTPKLADMVPRLVAEYRAEMEREADDADAEVQRLRAAQPPTEQWEYGIEYEVTSTYSVFTLAHSREQAEKWVAESPADTGLRRRRPPGEWVLVDQEEQK